MAFPPAAQTELGILRAIVEAGGTAMTTDPSFYRLIALYFPEIEEDDLRQTAPETGTDLWTSECQRLLARMLERGDLEGTLRDTVEITETGIARLRKRWLREWGPNPVQLPPSQPPPSQEPPPPVAENPPPGMWG